MVNGGARARRSGQEQAADDGHGGVLVVGEDLAGVLGAGDRPGADDTIRVSEASA